MPKRFSFITGVVLGALLAGCRDSTAPDKPFTVTLSIDAPPSPVITDTPNGPQIRCNFGLTVTATGNGSATWQGARTLWYIGPDRVNAIDTTTNAASEVQSALGSQTIAGGQTLHTNWYLYAGAPFEASLGFAYDVVNGQSSIASTRITCGPTPQGAVVPTITQVIVPMTGDLKIGDVVSVTFQATSASGIWETIVDVTGGFLSRQAFGEQLAQTVNRTVNFVVPSGVHPGVPVTVSVRAFNAALVGTSKSVETQLKFVDHTPPTLTNAAWLDRLNNFFATPLGGQYAVGDTIILSAYARDDNALGWLVYELGPPANKIDSVAATPGQTAMDWVVNITVPPEWVGAPVLKVYARDAAGLTSNSLSSPADSLRFYPRVDRNATAPLQLSQIFDSDDMVYDAKRDLMYVGIPRENKVVVFSPSTMTLKTPMTLSGAPAGMDLSLSGDSLLVAVPSTRTIAVFDLTQQAPAPTSITMATLLDSAGLGFPGAPPQPNGLRIAANGKMIVMLNNATSAGDEVAEIDLTTGAQRIRNDAHNFASPYAFWTRFMGRTPDRSRVYVLGFDCSSHYDSATDSFAACHSRVGADGGIGFDATGTRLTTANVLLDDNLQTLWSAEAITLQLPIVRSSPDASTIYLGVKQTLRKMRLADKTMLEKIPIPVSAERMFVAPSGAWVLVFQNSYGARVTRVNVQ